MYHISLYKQLGFIAKMLVLSGCLKEVGVYLIVIAIIASKALHHILIPPTLTKELDGDEMILEKHSILTQHHIYKFVWTPTIKEILHLEAEDSNLHDKYAGQ